MYPARLLPWLAWLALGAAITVMAGCPRHGAQGPGEKGTHHANTETDQPESSEGPSELIEDIELRQQETGRWCWAASGEMCMDFLGRDVTQCEQVSMRYPTAAAPAGCCAVPGSVECYKSGWPQFDKFGFSSLRTGEGPHTDLALSWEEIKAEIDADRPIAFTWRWLKINPDNPAGSCVPDGGHMMVVFGYFTDADGVNMVWVHDPGGDNNASTGFIEYETYVAKPCAHEHWHDYYGIAKSGLGLRLDIPERLDGLPFQRLASFAPAAAIAFTGAAAVPSGDGFDTEQPPALNRELRQPVPLGTSPGQPIAPGPAPFQPDAIAVGLQPVALLKARYTPGQVVQITRDAVKGAAPAAPAGVKTLKAQAERRPAQLGFASAAEARAAVLGDGLAVLRMSLSDLTTFQPPQTFFDFLQTPPDEVIWTVTSGARVCSSVTTDLRNGAWKATRFGAGNRIQGIAAARETLRQSAGGAQPVAEYLVSIPGLHVMLVAHQYADDKVVVAPTANHPAPLALDIKKAEPAADVLPRLGDAAKEVDPTEPG